VFIASNEGALWGGSESCWSAAAERLALRGVQVTASVRGWDEPVKRLEYLRSVGCRIVHRRPQTLVGRLGQKLLAPRGYTREHLRKIGNGSDLIVVSQGNNIDGLEWMEAARANSFRYSVIAQAAGPQWWPEDSIAKRLAECYEHACGSYFVSQANLALSRRQFSAPLRRAKVIRNPFNVRYDARSAWPGDPSEGLSLACVARLDVGQKGQDLLMEVLSRSHWRNRSIHVTLVGSGTNEGGLRQETEGLKLTSVSFAGFVNDVEKLWTRHHALLLASRYEGLPLSLVEAMLCGRACIVTDVGGNRELVRDGVNGFLAKAATADLLDEAMSCAWENRMRLKEMGETAAVDVRKLVSSDPVEDFISELASSITVSQEC
jgi:glycosyltransferase involved in cell wall biosynthesis